MHFRLLRGDHESFFNNRETRFYALIVLIGIIGVSFSLWFFDGRSILEALRYGSFQVVAIVTTTGFGTDDYELWYSFWGLFSILTFLYRRKLGINRWWNKNDPLDDIDPKHRTRDKTDYSSEGDFTCSNW